ncbi:uncharacterized protein isoform X4 [Castor canadensis]|uniref:Uncharacterized protein isoform X4 n=2 Tax=Castor canadensis TaxID=51338 RepID=A0AC58KU70_CASCN
MAASCPPARGGAWFSDCRGVLGERLRYRWAQSPGSGSGRCGLRCPGHCRGCGGNPVSRVHVVQPWPQPWPLPTNGAGSRAPVTDLTEMVLQLLCKEILG